MTLTQARYLLWAVTAWYDATTSCPACQAAATRLVVRKYLVTSLRECGGCGLRFRMPKNSDDEQAFYEEDYVQGFTTDIPDGPELQRLLDSRFAGHEKDYRRYLGILSKADVTPPARLLDFGASWGYGAWQLAQAGYRVVAYEIAPTRAAFARDRLGITMLEDPAAPPEPVDCFFSAHTMEHLPDPNIMWRAAVKALRPGGTFIAFMPNGDPRREGEPGYHRAWGLVHPMLITPDYLRWAAQHHGFVDTVTGASPDGAELSVVARKA